ncbi:hypothetical protein [Chelativorans sp. M5D2P16]|uniref:hypothetical protein n=1 Tax=Chelativorans sp. M5D2P16 TaxID=3095678 RepID=UPI002ACB04A2|nr:hypothetical protein [Chelativorans sp. M5D2P16]MDZ5697086.1 hypothetical protein [Chelativorans sp. M5D2P16]
MRNPIKALAIAAMLIIGFAAATTLHAQEPETPSGQGSMMGDGGMNGTMGQDGMSGMGDMNGMMGMMKMMAQMGPMMEQCTRMMADMTEHMKAAPDQ